MNHATSPSGFRRVLGLLAVGATAIALSVTAAAVPASATPRVTAASTASTTSASVLSKINAFRAAKTPDPLSTLITTPVLTKPFQQYALYCSTHYTDCSTTNSLTCPGFDCSLPEGGLGDDFGVVKVANGSHLATRIAAALIAYPDGQLATWYGNYALIGFVAKTTYTYVTFGIFNFPDGPGVFTLEGTQAVGNSLTFANSGFTTEPTDITYTWQKNNVTVSDTTSSYPLGASDWNSMIAGTAHWMLGDIPVQSTIYTAEIAKGTFVAPTSLVSGRFNVGQVLTGAPLSAWSPVPAGLHFIWKKDGVAITGQTDSTYTIQPGDLGHHIDLGEVAVPPADSNYDPGASTTHTSTKVAGVTFDLPGLPTIVDATNDLGPFYHDVLSIDLPGSFSPAPTSTSYQWYRNGSKISGATHATYSPGAAEIGKILTVRVTAAKSHYVSASVTALSSSANLVQGLAFDAVGTPTVTGTFEVGHTLTAHVGSWSPKPTSFSYQWERDGVAIHGATHSTYLLSSANSGHSVDVIVQGHRADYDTGAANSDSHPISTSA